jgi:hypothetical protein
MSRPFSRLAVVAALAAIGVTSAVIPASASTTTTVTVAKAASSIASSLNRISTSSTTPADFEAQARGAAALFTGVSVTAVPFYRNYVFFNVTAADGTRCVATRLPAGKPRFSSVNADCTTYVNIVGPDLDRALVATAKTELRLLLNAFSRNGSLLRPRKFTPALIQEFGVKMTTEKYTQKYTVTNIPNGIRVAVADRPSATFTITADNSGRYRM